MVVSNREAAKSVERKELKEINSFLDLDRYFPADIIDLT